MEDAKQQLVEKLKSASNVLVTVSRDPSVDQLSALLGLTLALNKQGKHAAAVFSGEVPSTLEFLQPEETIEKNTDSLRDFIIALDKSKADKLRYKVEDNMVRIFITPYRTSITQDDFEFSQGDFNVDLVIALGVQKQEDLDEAIVNHGRILHDATVASISTADGGELGTINWTETDASSLSELSTELVQELDHSLLDQQIATALLTGIVAETDRFSNDKTSAQTMSASAALMAAGANQQLVASKLQGGGDSGDLQLPEGDNEPKPGNGEIEINHDETAETNESSEPSEPASSPDEDMPAIELPSPDDDEEENESESDSNITGGSRLITEPPTLGGTLTANSQTQGLEPTSDPLSMPTSEEPQLLTRQPEPAVSAPSPTPMPSPTPAPEPPPPAKAPEPVIPGMTPPPPAWVPPSAPQPDSNQTLSDLEQSVASSHIAEPLAQPAESSINDARDEVSKALSNLTAADTQPPQLPSASPEPTSAPVIDPNAPPPVPPPIYQPPGSTPQQ